MKTLFLYSLLVLVQLVFSYQSDLNHGHNAKSARFEVSRTLSSMDLQVSRKHEIREVFSTNYFINSNEELDFSAQAEVLFKLVSPADVKVTSSHKTPHVGSLSPPVLS